MAKFNWWKFGVIAAAAIAIFYGGCRCGSGGKQPPTITTTQIDTLVLPGTEKVYLDTVYIPKPYKVFVSYKEFIKLPGEVITDTQWITTETRYYSDTIRNKLGAFVIDDTLANNKIIGRNLSATLNLPGPTVITETKILETPKKSIFYIGLNGTGSKQHYFYSIGPDFSLKTKNDKMYSIGVSVTTDNQFLFGAGFKIPIKL